MVVETDTLDAIYLVLIGKYLIGYLGPDHMQQIIHLLEKLSISLFVGVVIHTYPGAAVNEDNCYFLNGYSTGVYSRAISIYNSDVDPRSYGQCEGLLRKNISSGYWAWGIASGSRAIAPRNYASASAYAVTTRGCKERYISLGRHITKNLE